MEVEQPANTCYLIYLASYTPPLPFLYMYVCILHNQKISELHILKFGGLEVRTMSNLSKFIGSQYFQFCVVYFSFL